MRQRVTVQYLADYFSDIHSLACITIDNTRYFIDGATLSRNSAYVLVSLSEEKDAIDTLSLVKGLNVACHTEGESTPVSVLAPKNGTTLIRPLYRNEDGKFVF